MYIWQSLLVCLGSLSCMSTNHWPTSQVRLGSYDPAVCCNSRSDPISPSPGTNPRLYNRQKSPTHTRASSLLYGWCDTGSYSSFTDSSRHIDPPLWTKDFEFWFIGSKDCSIFQSFCALTHCSLLSLLCFFNSGFLTAILPYRPASQSLLFTVNVDTFFTRLVQLCSNVWSSQPLVTQTINSDEIVLYPSCCYQTYFLSCFVPFPEFAEQHNLLYL